MSGKQSFGRRRHSPFSSRFFLLLFYFFHGKRNFLPTPESTWPRDHGRIKFPVTFAKRFTSVPVLFKQRTNARPASFFFTSANIRCVSTSSELARVISFSFIPVAKVPENTSDMLAKSESLLSNYGATKDNGSKLFLVSFSRAFFTRCDFINSLVYLLFLTLQETHLDKSSEKCSSKIGCDIGRIEMGLTRSDSEEAAVNEATETEIDPWALTDLVDTSEKWSGNYKNFTQWFCSCRQFLSRSRIHLESACCRNSRQHVCTLTEFVWSSCASGISTHSRLIQMQLSARRTMENEERMWRQIYRAENFKRIEKRDSNLLLIIQIRGFYVVILQPLYSFFECLASLEKKDKSKNLIGISKHIINGLVFLFCLL